MKGEIRLSFSSSEEQRYWFGFYKKIKAKKINNWDAKWFLSIIYSGGLCITPTRNLIKNIGFGDNATNTKDKNGLQIDLDIIDSIQHPEKIEVNYQADNYIFKKIYKINILRRVYNKVIKWIKK